MDKVWADKWVNALRSGEYSQTKGCLKNDKGHCCLGVLCEIAGAEFIPTEVGNDEIRFGINDTAGRGGLYSKEFIEYAVLPNSVREITGVKLPGGSLPKREVYDGNSLASFNDAGKTFDEIADIIEKEWNNL